MRGTKSRRRVSSAERFAFAQESLLRAQLGQVGTNYPAIIEGFAARGIPENEILPRENVFTFDAWRALGRHVKRGEKGVRVSTWVPMSKKTEGENGEEVTKDLGCRPHTAYVFHVSQTEPDEVRA